MNDYMLDWETLDTIPSARVLSVGISEFDPLTGEIGEEFYARFDTTSQYNIDRTASADTIRWWGEQEKSVREEAFSGKQPLSAFIRMFNGMCDGKTKVWGNGATFDISILEDIYRQAEAELPYKFWNVRDVRTTLAMGRDLIDYKKPPAPKNAHNPIIDTRYQIGYVSDIYKQIALLNASS